MGKIVKLVEISRFGNDAKEGTIIRRTDDTRELYTPNGIVKGEDYRIDRIIDDSEYRLTRLSNGEKITTFLNGNERRYLIVEKAAEVAPVKQSETLRTIIDPATELTVGTVIRRTERDTSCAQRGIEYGYDYRIISSDSMGMGNGVDLTLRCLKTNNIIELVIGNTRDRYHIVEQSAQQDAEPEATTELDRFESIYRTLLANGIDSVKSVKSALEIVRMK